MKESLNCLGNVSNPSINRWGLNTLWHRFWFKDWGYSSCINQDRNITALVETYLLHGLETPNNFFSNPYWYSNNLVNLKRPVYFRWILAKNKTLGFRTTYRLRVQTTDFYPMKIWILRYSRWLIINFYWFQPNKYKKRKTQKKWQSAEITDTPYNKYLEANVKKRLKTLTTFNFLRKSFLPNYYVF